MGGKSCPLEEIGAKITVFGIAYMLRIITFHIDTWINISNWFLKLFKLDYKSAAWFFF